MNIRTTYVHLDKDSRVEDYIIKRFSTLSKFVSNESLCQVTVSKISSFHNNVPVFKVEANIKGKPKDVFSVSEKKDIFEAVDDLREELEKILSSNKEKRWTVFRKGAQRIKNILKGFRNKNE